NWGHDETVVYDQMDTNVTIYVSFVSVPAIGGRDSADSVVLGLTRNAQDDAEWWIALSPKSVLFPTLALAAFLACKGTWAVIERRRRRTRPDGAIVNSQGC
ncbi:MAG: hypothetical protein AB7U73_02305, partial [Pirellulales bacterium]